MLPLLLAFGEDPAWRARHALAYAFAPLARGLDAPAALRAAYAKLMTDPEAEVRAAACTALARLGAAAAPHLPALELRRQTARTALWQTEPRPPRRSLLRPVRIRPPARAAAAAAAAPPGARVP